MTDQRQAINTSGLFLPDLCGVRAVFVVVVAAQLLAIVLTLASDGRGIDAWRELALSSLFVQWVALSSIAVLCLLRGPLARIGNVKAATCSYLTILAVALAVSEVAYQVFAPGLSAAAADHWRFEMGSDGGGALLPLRSPVASHREFMLDSLGITAIVAAVVLRYFYVQHQWKARVESENLARIQALQSRIRPHFLFNSMNTIASLARSAPELAEQVTEDLADLFRVSLGDARVPGTVGQEMELCRQYLRIEGVRLGERLKAQVDAQDLPVDALLPALTVQPLVENAVYHGVEPVPEGGEILVRGQRDGDHIVILVRNTCPAGGSASARPGNRMALDNVRQRLNAFFEGDAEVEVSREEDGSFHRFQVAIRFATRSANP